MPCSCETKPRGLRQLPQTTQIPFMYSTIALLPRTSSSTNGVTMRTNESGYLIKACKITTRVKNCHSATAVSPARSKHQCTHEGHLKVQTLRRLVPVCSFCHMCWPVAFFILQAGSDAGSEQKPFLHTPSSKIRWRSRLGQRIKFSFAPVGHPHAWREDLPR